VVYDLLGDTDVGLCSFAYRFRGVEVPIETREIAAGDVKPDTMPSLEDIAGLREREGHLVDLTWSQHGGVGEGLPKPGPMICRSYRRQEATVRR